jgi:phage host-nuclease inhibitor protein Gam
VSPIEGVSRHTTCSFWLVLSYEVQIRGPIFKRLDFMTKDEFVTKTKAQLDRWNAEIDELEAKARKAKAGVTEQYAKQIAMLRAEVEEGRKRLSEIQDSSNDTWQQFKEDVQDKWTTFSTAVQRSKEAFVESLQKGDS